MTPIKLTEQLLRAFDTKKEAQEYIIKQQGFDKIAGNVFEYEMRPEHYTKGNMDNEINRTVYRVIKHTVENISL